MTEKALEGGLKMLLDPIAGAKFVEYPPNAMQFRALCRQYYESLDLPPMMDAYRDVQRYASEESLPDGAHEVVRYIASRLPETYFKMEHDIKKKKIFVNLYNKVCDLVLSGHPIPAVEVKSRKKPVNPTIGRQNLNAMYAILGIRPKQETATC